MNIICVIDMMLEGLRGCVTWCYEMMGKCWKFYLRGDMSGSREGGNDTWRAQGENGEKNFGFGKFKIWKFLGGKINFASINSFLK